jgi:hypothetical protein
MRYIKEQKWKELIKQFTKRSDLEKKADKLKIKGRKKSMSRAKKSEIR